MLVRLSCVVNMLECWFGVVGFSMGGRFGVEMWGVVGDLGVCGIF